MIARIKSNMDVVGECWIWRGAKDRDGYGRIRVGGRKVKRVHRASWEAANNGNANGMLVCHHCDTPSCVNPKHLYLGTVLDNNRDKMAKGRGMFHHGQDCVVAKLTDKDVMAAFDMYATGDFRQKDIAAHFGVSTAAIQLILSGKNWKHKGVPPVKGMRSAPKKALRKLTIEVVAALVAEYRNTKISQIALAKKYGVSQQYVSLAVSKGS